MKVFFEPFDTPFETLPFGRLETGDYLPAAKHAIQLTRERLDKLKSSAPATFQGFVHPFLESSRELDLISHAFYNLHSANTNDEMEQVAQQLSPLLAQFSNDLLLDTELFQKIQATYKGRSSHELTTEEQTILTDQYQTFVRNGALLREEDKQSLRKIDQRLAQLGVEFGRNALQAKNQFVRSLTEDDLQGIPSENWEVFQNAAVEKGRTGYAVTLDHPVLIPFIKGCHKRALREEVHLQSQQVAAGGEFDNRPICREIIRLRRERAELLGYPDHAAFTLERRMAESSQQVMSFLQDLKHKAMARASEEIAELTSFAQKTDQLSELKPWDFQYYSEKHKKELFDFDDETLRPYFQLENVIQGVFQVASKLYQLDFRPNEEIPRYHPDVVAYEVIDQKSSKSSQVCGILYGDFFPRPSKRHGAWMCNYRNQSQTQIPHVGIVCSFTKSTSSKPSLLTHSEVLTLFHEFGHALHGLLSQCQYSTLSGPQVYWDFVELPSQIMENWAYEKECLDLFARHYQTGELMDQTLVEKIRASRVFMAGYATMRQLSFATLDMTLHTMDPDQLTDIMQTEAEVMKEFDLFHYHHPHTSMCTSFSHIFNGGYSAGYYGYKWAEVLDADAFELFREHGVFHQATAQSFREHILARGGSEHPMVLYQRFRGHKPSTDPLLKRCGLIAP